MNFQNFVMFNVKIDKSEFRCNLAHTQTLELSVSQANGAEFLVPQKSIHSDLSRATVRSL